MRFGAPAIVFDLGGTHLRGATAPVGGGLTNIAKHKVRNFLDGSSATEVWSSIIDHIVSYVSAFGGSLPAPAPVVLAVPGPVRGRRILLDAPTLVGHDGAIPDVKTILEERTGRRVFILNDVSAATWYFSEKVPDDRFMVITVSSGIGSKIFDRRHPLGVLDEVEYGGEIGHATAGDFPERIRCDCGGWNHVGAISSGRGILQLAMLCARRDQQKFNDSAIGRSVCGNPEQLTNERHIVPSVIQGDAWTLGVVEYATRPLAQTLLTSWLAIGLTRIVVIGGFALALGAHYVRILENELQRLADYKLLQACVGGMVTLGQPDEEACLIGAAVYAQREDCGG
ncbi:MAG: ROK family protein [Deltaproteobacteria bacterium]|nr:MAG: ROK family protein [Deltaproteobacteria bacterium]